MAIGTSKIGVLGGGGVPAGSQTFNAPGTFTVPVGITKVNITGKGGTGTAGNAGNAGNSGYGARGGDGGNIANFQWGGPCYCYEVDGCARAGASAINRPAGPNCGFINGNSGSAGSAGSAGNSSTGLAKTFPGGAAGNGGSAGTGGTGAPYQPSGGALIGKQSGPAPGVTINNNPNTGTGGGASTAALRNGANAGPPTSRGAGGGGGAGISNSGTSGAGYSTGTAGTAGTACGGAGGLGLKYLNTPIYSNGTNCCQPCYPSRGTYGVAPGNRAGGGGAAGAYFNVSGGPTPLSGTYNAQSGGGGGRGGVGNPGSGGNPGSAATPATYNCQPVTPGGSYPIVVGGPSAGQVVISWNAA